MSTFCIVLDIGPMGRQGHEKVSTTMRSNTKTKRRRAKRDGLPKGALELQFLTASNPDQFRDDNVRKSVRVQAAMNRCRKLKTEGGKKDVEADEKDVELDTNEMFCPDDDDEPIDHQNLVLLNPGAAHNTQAPPGSEISGFSNGGATHRDLSRSSLAYLVHSARSSTSANVRVVNYEYSTKHEEAMDRMFVAKVAMFHQIGDGVDPFDVMPQYDNPELSVVWLQRNCMRAFACPDTMKKWTPYMLSHQDVLLSSPLLASTWVDMNAGLSGLSKRTTMVRAEILSMLSQRLSSQETMMDDTTFVVILHLLGGEMFTLDENVLRMHKEAMVSFVAQRGGLHGLHNQALAEVAAACYYHCDAFCESAERTVFHAWQPSPLSIDPHAWNMPESPLFCLTPNFITLERDLNCRPHTLQLLEDMRCLTDLFVGQQDCPLQFCGKELEEPVASCLNSSERQLQMEEISRRIAILPSAHVPGQSTFGDWIYEACRIAALIYTTAILTKVPFSVAAEVEHTLNAIHTNSIYRTGAQGQLQKTHLTQALYETLQKTDTGSIWADMSGVLYWVTAVGAAAARRPATMDMSPQTRFQQEEYSVWVRRCLTLHATRVMIVHVFQHPVSILWAQKRLLRVQELLGTSQDEPVSVF